MRKAALQDLIDRQLIIQAFDKDKLQIPPHYIDERVDAVIKENFGGDRHAFIKTMESQKYTMSKFRDLEREKIIVQAMRAKNVTSNLIIPPGKVDEYYRKHKELFSNKAQVKLRMIMIPGHTESGGGEAQSSMAEEIRAKLITGADFDKMAQMYSEDSTRELGGDWGWIDDKTLAPELSQGRLQPQSGRDQQSRRYRRQPLHPESGSASGRRSETAEGCPGRHRSPAPPGASTGAPGTLARQSALEGLHQDLLV